MNILSILVSLVVWSTILCTTWADPQDAARFRRLGEEAMLKKNYQESVNLFTQLIAVSPVSSSYFKRATVYFRQGNYPACVEDLNHALQLSHSTQDGERMLLQRAQARLHLGQCTLAAKDASTIQTTQAREVAQKANECASILTKMSRYVRAHGLSTADARGDMKKLYALPAPVRAQLATMMAQAAGVAGGDPRVLELAAASALVHGDASQAVSLASKLSDAKTTSEADIGAAPVDSARAAVELRARAYYAMGELAAAVSYCKHGLRDDPEHRVLQKLFKQVKAQQRAVELSDDAASKNKWPEAVDSLQKAIKADDSPREGLSKLHVKMCKLQVRAANQGSAAATTWAEKAITACKAALDAVQRIQGGSKEATQNTVTEMNLELGDALLLAGKNQEAMQQFQNVLQRDRGNRRAQEGMQRAQTMSEQAKKKDYYKILGLSRTANKREIKKAYHKLAKQHHPDMVKEEDKTAAQNAFADISEAYEVLSDPEKRAKYDRGEDIFGNNPQPRGPQMHPFGGFGGGGPRFHQGGGFPFGGGGFGGGGFGGQTFSFRFG